MQWCDTVRFCWSCAFDEMIMLKRTCDIEWERWEGARFLGVKCLRSSFLAGCPWGRIVMSEGSCCWIQFSVARLASGDGMMRGLHSGYDRP